MLQCAIPLSNCVYRFFRELDISVFVFVLVIASVALKFIFSMQQEWYLSQISLLFPCYFQLIPYSMTVNYPTDI